MSCRTIYDKSYPYEKSHAYKCFHGDKATNIPSCSDYSCARHGYCTGAGASMDEDEIEKRIKKAALNGEKQT